MPRRRRTTGKQTPDPQAERQLRLAQRRINRANAQMTAALADRDRLSLHLIEDHAYTQRTIADLCSLNGQTLSEDAVAKGLGRARAAITREGFAAVPA